MARKGLGKDAIPYADEYLSSITIKGFSNNFDDVLPYYLQSDKRHTTNSSQYGEIDSMNALINITSDRRLKNVGEKFTGGLDEIKKLDLYNFTFKADKAKTPQVGVMAQDLQKVFPNSVWEGADKYLKIRWDEMFYAVINAVKELDTKIENAFAQIKSNSDELEELKAQVEEQKQIIQAQQETINELQKLEKRIKKLEKKNKQ